MNRKTVFTTLFVAIGTAITYSYLTSDVTTDGATSFRSFNYKDIFGWKYSYASNTNIRKVSLWFKN